jgi:hypothetical protein
MPYIPSSQTLNANSAQILNAVRNDLKGYSQDGFSYYNLVPVAQSTTESIRNIGSTIMQYSALQNAFISTLVNRIGRVIITSKLYENPWKNFKKGLLEYGETIEEIFVNLAKPHNFNPDKAESELYKRELPDVSTAFHSMNYQKFYKVTVSNDQLRQAFLSWNGITDLIGRIIDSLYTGASYDEFLVMKYMLGRLALDGKITPVTIPTISADNAKSIVSTIKGISNKLEYLSNKYNMMGVSTLSKKEEQNLILDSDFDAKIDVEVLASAFNMDKAQFMGKRIGVDSFADIDTARLDILFKDDSTYTPFTQEELNLLAKIPAMILDDDFFMIFDNYQNMTEKYNSEGLYWNYWFHKWNTFSASPFANAVLFTTLTPAITSVAVSPSTATVNKGSSLQLTATVVGDGLVNKNIDWIVSGEETLKSTITSDGLLKVANDETNTTLTVIAVSVFDNTKKAIATITVG